MTAPRQRLMIDLDKAIIAQWPYSPAQLGAAWLILLQHHAQGRTFEYYDQPRPRGRLLGMSTRQWNRERPYILACFNSLLSAVELEEVIGRRTIPQTVRMEIYARDGGACQYCGVSLEATAFHCDHVVPVSAGGGDGPDNLVCACPPCNLSKAAKPLDAWRARG